LAKTLEQLTKGNAQRAEGRGKWSVVYDLIGLNRAQGCRPVIVDRCPGSKVLENWTKIAKNFIMYSIYLTIYLSIAQEIKEG